MRRLLAATVVAVALVLGVTGSAAADAIPGDDACQPWEHWEGAHDGECKFGCSITDARPTPGNTTPRWIAASVLVAIGVVALRRRRR